MDHKYLMAGLYLSRSFTTYVSYQFLDSVQQYGSENVNAQDERKMCFYNSQCRRYSIVKCETMYLGRTRFDRGPSDPLQDVGLHTLTQVELDKMAVHKPTK
ncbi:UNVERIFIED_CONTAM: hypothetical protein FKN15_048121 [Acipenser sinensis]